MWIFLISCFRVSSFLPKHPLCVMCVCLFLFPNHFPPSLVLTFDFLLCTECLEYFSVLTCSFCSGPREAEPVSRAECEACLPWVLACLFSFPFILTFAYIFLTERRGWGVFFVTCMCRWTTFRFRLVEVSVRQYSAKINSVYRV